MHPNWQIKQIITVDRKHYVDRNLAFGSSGSPGIFISFNSLVAWIAKYVKEIHYISDYVDDSSGCNQKGDMSFYPPYGNFLQINAIYFFYGTNSESLTKNVNRYMAHLYLS